jgi:hypothetical protein
LGKAIINAHQPKGQHCDRAIMHQYYFQGLKDN